MANTGQYDSQTNIELEDYEREIFMRPEAAVMYGGSVVNSVNGQVGDVVLTTSDLENTSDYQTGAQVQNAIAGKQDKLTAGSGLNLDGTILSVDTNIIATVQDVTDEATIRENSDANLQGQIDALTVSSDVIDVLGTYQDLQNYDTSHVKANDIIKVLQDSTHNNSMSYYRWEITDHVGSWVYVGSEGPYYTKSEADALLDSKQNVIADLPQIRSGAEAGATAVQPEDLARIATTGSYNDSLDKPSINNVVLIGNKSLDALGIQSKGNYALESEIPDVSNFITNTVDNLVNYYKKSETFTKQEVNDLISAITTMDIRVVQTLPTEDISTTTIYFVPKTTAGTNDVYDEYIYVSNAWEHIGSTDIDLSGYQTKIDSSHKLSSDLVDDTNQTNKFVTENEKTTWNTEIENLQEEDELLKRNLQTTTGSGEEVTLEKTAELDFVKPPLPRGNTKQNTTTGKNLLNTTNANTTTLNGVTAYRSNGFYYLSGTNTKTNATWVLPSVQNTNLPTFEIGQTYTMSFKGTMPNGIYAQLNGVKTSTGTQYSIGSVQRTVPSLTFTIDSDYSRTAQLFIGIQATVTNADCNFAIQIEKGSTATSYEPYTGGIPSPNPSYPQEVEVVTGNVEVTISNENNTESKTLPVSLGNIELCKLGDYQDYLYKNNGKWYKHNAIKKLVLNGSENWTAHGSIASWFFWDGVTDGFVDNTISGYALSNYFTQKPYSTVTSLKNGEFAYGQVAGGGPRKRFVIKDTDYTTVADFKSWLSTHNTIVYYVLATPTDTEITDTTLISQLEEISKALSYQGQTNITSNTIALFDVEAYQDLKIVLEDLDLTKLSTFDSTKTQILKNVNGTLTWVDG